MIFLRERLRTKFANGHPTLFSDTKSHGFGLDKSGIRQPERLARFVITVFLAYIYWQAKEINHILQTGAPKELASISP